MDELAVRFEEHRAHLRGVAYRLLGSLPAADDAVQEAWLRLDRSDAGAILDLRAWLTTVVSRVCLNQLRGRREVHVPDPVVSPADALGPEDEALVADSVGLAMLVVLEALSPAERLAFVLHDVFAVPFPEVATILDRTPEAVRQLASRARRRVQGAPVPDVDLAQQRSVVDAFFAAARAGDFEGLLAVLDPDVAIRTDVGGEGSTVTLGATAVASRAITFADPAAVLHPVLVNGAAGIRVTVDGELRSIMGFTVVGDRIVEVDVLRDPARLAQYK